jgi:hypothetical protein
VQPLTAPRARSQGAVAGKVTSDGNPNALDAGLDALTAFLHKADDEYAGRCAHALRSQNTLCAPRLTLLCSAATELRPCWQTT